MIGPSATIVLPGKDQDDEQPFHKFIEGVRAQIDQRIGEHIALHASGDDILADHFQGGKRLRAGTALLVHAALSDGEEGKDMALDLAAALEFAHGISLMIDDLLDGDQARRGKASLHALRGQPQTMLEAVRMLAVPYALAAPHGASVTALLAAAHEKMVQGAIAELDPEGMAQGVAAYDRLISMKSGGLFELAARFGALAAGCCDDKAALAGGYGSSLGMVHQFSDDIVDLGAALSTGQVVRGSEACLLRWVVPNQDERRMIIDRGRLPEEVEMELGRELQLRVRRAERSAMKLARSVGRCGGRRRKETFLPLMRSAPMEIAKLMIGPERSGGGIKIGHPTCSEDRS